MKLRFGMFLLFTFIGCEFPVALMPRVAPCHDLATGAYTMPATLQSQTHTQEPAIAWSY